MCTSDDEYPRTIVEVLFRWYQRLQSNIVFTNSSSLHPKLDQYGHYPSKHKPILNLDCYKVVKTLCTPVSIFLHSSLKVWSQKWPLPTSAETPPETLEATVLLSLLSRIRSSESVISFRCVKCVRRLCKFQSFTMTSFLVLIVLSKPNTHCGADASLAACQKSASSECLCLRCNSEKSEWSACPSIGLEITFQEWLKLLQSSVSFSWRCDPMLRLVRLGTCDTILFLSQSRETPMT